MIGIPSIRLGCGMALIAATSISFGASAADVSVAIVSDDAAAPSEAVAYAVPRSPNAIAAAKLPIKNGIVDQKGKEFVPLSSAVRVGTPIDFPNSDNIRHQVYSFSPAKVFNLKLYSGRPSTPVIFDQPGVVTLGCNIHDRMIAWVLVVDTPWIAHADARGIATFKQLPEGEYELRVWHPGINTVTHAATVGEIVRVSDTGSQTKTMRIQAMPIASLRRELQSGEGADNTIAPPRVGAN